MAIGFSMEYQKKKKKKKKPSLPESSFEPCFEEKSFINPNPIDLYMAYHGTMKSFNTTQR